MTVAERNVLGARGVTGVRLSRQILCDHDMTVRAISRLTGSGRARSDRRQNRKSPRRRSDRGAEAAGQRSTRGFRLQAEESGRSSPST